ncbi:hypothetical protein [Kordiimonas sp.]|uniref:hypothetical protein n=1 Tax=Kordiimonas sp. TaxID=1970157 RepID=UPI003A932FA0
MATHNQNRAAISRRTLLGGTVGALVISTLSAGTVTADYSAERGAGILQLIRQLDMYTCESNELDAKITADKNRPDIDELRAREAACEAEVERLYQAIANYECHCVEDVLYQLAYFTDTDAYAEDKTADLCEFGGNKNQYTRIMKNFAHVLGTKPIDTVHGLLSPATRSLGY